jgi:hypothetical protein
MVKIEYDALSDVVVTGGGPLKIERLFDSIPPPRGLGSDG